MNSSLSEEEMRQVLAAELQGKDKEMMEQMLRQGYSMEEILEHFQSRAESRADCKSELSRKIKKLSSGRKLSSEDMLQLIKEQLGEEGRSQLEKMLKEGQSMQQ